MENTHEALVEITEINGVMINVYGVWNSEQDYEDNKDPEYYDVYEADGMISTCLNEGNPLYEKPTVSDCEELLNEYHEDDEE
jgi:hypothetical protein